MCLLEPRTAIHRKPVQLSSILILKSSSTCGVGYGRERFAEFFERA
ncbi:hypothetical protein ACO2KO_03525 [Leptospira interrogans]|nr:hypothetical protein [Leptospira interrogans]EJO77198.1 hypothetical protein LEP1GSC045_0946 [Leptospira interrogans serovar Pomona str. Kennewicki LC82-25]EKN96674.1 hypothetical protein LEP1GSC014_3718 [Leptospira interrogans serovar Pomona str. Pomona]EMF32368.1 hypothetical protein LEP1GSC201_4177 [Leptospira interrogans serovar Pomona str. Fox 32256]EMI68370.1 hypothetical protein LEP1GSC200_4125 [Leptospira interrogans serovar Pomona str. CSL10083]EMN55756.1 hypothetical protein LEP1G